MNELTKGCTLQHGKYKIVKTLGRGSFGITYLATTKVALSGALGEMDVTVNVAIKEFFMEEFNSRSRDGSSVDGTSSSLVKNYRKKFHREAENLGKLKHPNIVKVLEVFDENNTTYYAMEYVEGESLDDYIKSKGRIPESEVLIELQEIGAALRHMHDHKMLHLDLKPKNIMRNKEGHILLIDFGLSKQYDQNGEPESSTTLGLGTPGYAPIEQANYKQDGSFPATLDIYAFGASIYKMLTGSTPPHASDILSEGFPEDLFSKLGVSAEMTAVVEKAMSPIKKQRYQTISELLEEIDSKKTHIQSSKDNNFGSYKIIVGEAEYGTEELINVDIDDPLPIPDKGISIVLSNPASGSLSYRFYLNNGVCNTVFVYRNGEIILEEEFLGGIRPEVIEALKENGFFSKVHWEQESSTTVLEGILVSCSFFYKNGDKFVREVKHANPAYHHLLLDAVYNVVKVKELSQWINKALDREQKYNPGDVEQYGISVFSFTPNYEMPIYYRGHTYSGDNIGAYGLKSSSKLEVAFERVKYIQKKSTNQIDFDSYLWDNKKSIAESFNIITYCSESDLLRVLYKLRQNPSVYGNFRIVQEMQLLPLCFDCTKDSIIGFEYQRNLYCEAEFGGGIAEILQAGFEDTKEAYTKETMVKKLTDFESFTSLLLSSVIQYHILQKDWEEDRMLLSMMPYDIKAEIWIYGRYRDGFHLIQAKTLIPCRNSKTISDDNCIIVISCLGKRFSIDVKELFRYNPKSFEITVDINPNTNIKYTLKDKEREKEISISQSELFNYQINTHNEDTSW